MLNKKILSLTQLVKPTSPTWSGNQAFQTTLIHDYSTCTSTTKFRVQEISFAAGTGTHIDAPAHCILGGRTVDQLTQQELITSCVVIDASTYCKIEDSISEIFIKNFEQLHHPVWANAVVFFYTGWDIFWDSSEKFRGNLNFPSLSAAAAKYLIERKIAGIGIDTLSPDKPGDTFPVHEIILGADRFIIENVANLEKLPAIGAIIMVNPLPFEGLTEAPVNLKAFF